MILAGPACSALLAALRGQGLPRAMPLVEQPDHARRGRDTPNEANSARAARVAEDAQAAYRLGALALARESVMVVLEDGSALSIDDAELLLLRKEERRAHRALRAAVDRALSSVRQFSDDRSQTPTQAGQLTELLAGTEDLAFAALGALRTLAKADIGDELSLCWALDLPGAAVSLELARALVEAGRVASGVALRRARVPRAIAGVVLVDEVDGVVRLGTFEGVTRLERLVRTVRGGYSALANAASLSPTMGLATGLGVFLPPVLRQAGLSRSDADWLTRLAAARSVLELRAAAALALYPWPEACERAIPLPVRPIAALRELLVEQGTGQPEQEVEPVLHAAGLALALRDAYDDSFAISRRAWLEPPASNNVRVAEAWVAWASPWL